MKVLEWSHVIHTFFTHSMAAYSLVGGGVLSKFKLIKRLLLSSLPVRTRKVQNIKALEWSQHFFHSKYLGLLCQFWLSAGVK